jgi:hypothetical protein
VIDLDAIQLRRADEQMADERCYQIVKYRRERDLWEVAKDRARECPEPRDRCLGCGQQRKGSHYRSYCMSCGLRVHATGTIDSPQDYLIWKLGRKVKVTNIVNWKGA